ncbi:MAG: hypothetical protein EBY24_23005, partial [Betaproteobacteria bacterium]|nr:hypothetical protein [Betaproteobacteria bacterium]
SGTPAFFGTTYSETLSSEKFATAFVTDLIGARATAADKSALVAVLVGRMAAGATQSAVIGELTGLLATVPSSNSSWGAAATSYNTTVATKIIDNLLGSSAATASKLAIVDAVISLMAAGVGVGRVVELLVTALDGCSHTDATWGAAATLFDNRVDVARYYSVDKAGAATDIGTLQQVLLGVSTLTSSVLAAKARFDAPLAGVAQDGYLSGATVFVDANGDGQLSAGEVSVVTDAKGGFSLPAGAFGVLVIKGGVDISTNLPFTGSLSAPAGATVINPLTTLQQGFVEQGKSVAQAQQAVSTALGLDNTAFDLTSFDPLSTALDLGASAAQRALGAQLQTESAKVANFLVAASATLSGVVGAAALTTANASQSLLESLVNAMTADSDGVVSFSDQSFLAGIVTSSVAVSGNAELIAAAATVETLSVAVASMSAASADSVDAAFSAGGDIGTMMAVVAQAQVVAQGAMSTAILGAAASGDFS